MARMMVCTHEFLPEADDELAMSPGDRIQTIVPNRAGAADEQNWLTGRNLTRGGIEGLFPSTGFCMPIPASRRPSLRRLRQDEGAGSVDASINDSPTSPLSRAPHISNGDHSAGRNDPPSYNVDGVHDTSLAIAVERIRLQEMAELERLHERAALMSASSLIEEEEWVASRVLARLAKEREHVEAEIGKEAEGLAESDKILSSLRQYEAEMQNLAFVPSPDENDLDLESPVLPPPPQFGDVTS